MKYEGTAKRAFDVVVAGTSLAILSPALCLVTAFNAAYLKENPIYISQRPGKKAIPFKIYKLKTMRTLKDSNGDLLPIKNRTTLFGSLLRHTAIDELFQLFNIIKGDMSLVGPRLRLAKHINQIPENERNIILSVAPGLTGPWQVASIGRKESTPKDLRVKQEVSYVQDGITFKRDLTLLWKTPKTFVLGHDGTITKLKHKAHEWVQNLSYPPA